MKARDSRTVILGREERKESSVPGKGSPEDREQIWGEVAE